MKIAYILGPQGPNFQDTYYDKFKVTSKRPWLQNNEYYTVPSDFYINDNGYKIRKLNPNVAKYVRIDIALGLYIKYYLSGKNIDFDLIPVTKLTNKVLSKYSLIINQFMDLLIVGQDKNGKVLLIEKFSRNGNQHSRLRNIYQKNIEKIYPPLKYQNLIYNKCDYYSFLKRHKFPVAKWFCFSKKKFIKNKIDLIKRLKKQTSKWGSLFAKPVHGVDGKDVKKLYDSINPKFKKEIINYATSIFDNPRYPHIVVQKFYENFEQNIPQFRLYFLDEKLSHSILGIYSNEGYKTYTPVQENKLMSNTYDFPDYFKLKKIAIKIIKKIKQKYFNNKLMFITRIDFGCCLDSEDNKYFINELEFNPGLYLHQDGSRKYSFDIKAGNLLLKIIKSYSNN